jgi:hypothetical protein
LSAEQAHSAPCWFGNRIVRTECSAKTLEGKVTFPSFCPTHLNRHIASNEIKIAIKILPKRKVRGPDRFTAELYHTIKELVEMLLKHFHKIERGEHCQIYFMNPGLQSSQNFKRTNQRGRITGQSF